MKIREAVEADLGAIAELMQMVHRMHVEAQPGTYRDISRDQARAFVTPRLADSDSFLRVAEVDAEVAGYCWAEVRTRLEIPLFQPGAFLYVNEIVVRPERRRSGVGRALFADLKEFARGRGISQIDLDVGAFNGEARAFFQSQGFGMVRERMSARAIE